MQIIYLLIGISIIMATGFLIAFIWSIKSGQMEDDYTPGIRILFDDSKKSDAAYNKKITHVPTNQNKSKKHTYV